MTLILILRKKILFKFRNHFKIKQIDNFMALKKKGI